MWPNSFDITPTTLQLLYDDVKNSLLPAVEKIKEPMTIEDCIDIFKNWGESEQENSCPSLIKADWAANFAARAAADQCGTNKSDLVERLEAEIATIKNELTRIHEAEEKKSCHGIYSR